MSNSNPLLTSRRTLLQSAGTGFGYFALAGLLGEAAAKAATADKTSPNPLAPKQPHFKPKAKRIIFLFMEGAMSTVDTVEYKPELQKNSGKPGPGGGTLVASQFQFKQFGQTGRGSRNCCPISALTPMNSAGCAACTPTHQPTRRPSCNCIPAAPTLP